MPSINGTEASIGIALSQAADTWGTAEAVTDKLVCESFTWNENPTVLESNSIGSGGLMKQDTQRGAIAGSFNIRMIVGFENGFDYFMAQLLGTAGAPSEQNNPEGDYLHTLTAASTLNANFITLAAETSSTTVAEFPSCAVTQIVLTYENPTNYVFADISGLFSEMVVQSPTNNNAALDALTEPDTERVTIQASDELLVNTQASGALTTSTDKVNFTRTVLTLARAQQFIPEVKGASGNGVPVSNGRPLTGTLQVDLKDHADNAWEIAAQAGTEYKAGMVLTGTQIGAGDNKKVEFFLPRMKHVITPAHGLSNPGQNPTALNFELMQATSNPTGMSDTTPYFEITNERTSAYIS